VENNVRFASAKRSLFRKLAPILKVPPRQLHRTGCLILAQLQRIGCLIFAPRSLLMGISTLTLAAVLAFFSSPSGVFDSTCPCRSAVMPARGGWHNAGPASTMCRRLARQHDRKTTREIMLTQFPDISRSTLADLLAANYGRLWRQGVPRARKGDIVKASLGPEVRSTKAPDGTHTPIQRLAFPQKRG